MSTSGIGFTHATVDQSRGSVNVALEGGVTRAKITNCDNLSSPRSWNVYVQQRGVIGEEASRRLPAPFLHPEEGGVAQT